MYMYTVSSRINTQTFILLYGNYSGKLCIQAFNGTRLKARQYPGNALETPMTICSGP